MQVHSTARPEQREGFLFTRSMIDVFPTSSFNSGKLFFGHSMACREVSCSNFRIDFNP
jgi:hypothetical protein